ncbi:MAG: translation initiation factor IF-2 [Alistipes sp.]|nr:translation initiation factor IF-2 [Alistipes sp.]
MSSERKLRLNQVAREFNVGLSTITDFLAKKGISIESSPSTLVGPEAYAVLEKEFGGNRSDGKVNIREKINVRHETVSLDKIKGGGAAGKESEPDFKDEVVIKTGGVISVKDEVAQRSPKILGKIDLSGGKSKPAAATPAPKPEVKAEADKPAEPVKTAPTPAPAAAPQVKPAAPAVEAASAPQATAPQAAATAPKTETAAPATAKPAAAPAAEVKPAATETTVKEAAPAAAPAQPEASKEAQAQTYDERRAADDSNVFRPSTEGSTLAGPKVLGKIDVGSLRSGRNESRREKRKRITKDKVDVTKQQPPVPGQRTAGGKGQFGQNKPGAGGRDAKKGGKGAKPKPVLRPEVSEEEVQKQIKDTLARLTSKGGKSKSAKYRRDKRDAVSARITEDIERAESEKSTLKVTEFVTVSELASMMDVSVNEVITACMNLGLMVSINQRLDAEALVVVAEEFGFKTEFVSVEIQEAIEEDSDPEEEMEPRPPIVTVMGHVDHGKTSLLDNIRKTNVIAGEAGGITQHIGAYSVNYEGKKITFLDTPGHEAFTAMRARGAAATDVAIIIVAADDSVMPQTVEAINHAAAAGVPMVFAINKIDKDGANPDHIKEQLAAMNYLVEDWGGKYQSQEVSAKQGINLDKLLEKVLLEAEFLDLKANPERKANGVVIESSLDKGRGYVSTILVENGTLRVGDILLSGTYTGRVKAMFDENGQKLDQAGPSTPVLVLGLNGAPQAGDTFNVMEDDRSAREIANKREQLQRMQGLRTQKHVTLDEIGRRIAIGNFKELNIIVKGDVDGSIEAMTDSLIKLSKEEVQVNVIHKAVGQISESDVLLAAASNAIIVGFQVRPSSSARKLAEKEEIEIRLYSIIYDAINDIKDAIEGMLAPVTKEEIVCSVEVLETFKISRVGTIAGCIVREGKITRNTPIRVIRDGIVVYTGKLGSLKRFKDDVKEVTTGMECGLNIDNFNDIKVGDIVEGYETVEVKR